MVNMFPLGTSRLHEPMEIVGDQVRFPQCGYFHSSSQMLDMVRLSRGEMSLTLTEARFFFRKDQTPLNPFNLDLWGDGLEDGLDHIRRSYLRADSVVMEISTPQSYKLGGIHVQGNPNYYRNAPYSQVWRRGYYAEFAPESGVIAYDDSSTVAQNVRDIASLVTSDGKRLVVLGHLVDPVEPHPVRKANNDCVRSAVNGLDASLGVEFYDQSHLVAEHGFRVLDDGSTDIHHLPKAALTSQANEIVDRCA